MFLNDHDPADVPAVLAVVGKMTGAGFHEPSAPRRPRTDHRFLRPAPQRLNPPRGQQAAMSLMNPEEEAVAGEVGAANW